MILALAEDAAQRESIRRVLDDAGRACRVVGGAEALIDELDGPEGAGVEAVVVELGGDLPAGVDAFRRLAAPHPGVRFIAVSGAASVSAAVDVMKAGAADYLIRPFAPSRLIAAIGGISGSGRAPRAAGARGGSPGRAGGGFAELVSESAVIRSAIAESRRVAASSLPVLITGESGVGKEVFARAIHAESPRGDGPFVAVNCGALPDALVESILFGHEKGAFTGAVERRIGKFQEAGGGTLFLDEIGELPLDAQVKLLRAVQEGEVDPVGGARSAKTDIRVISATNRSLEAEVGQGRFREDLYYRLCVFTLRLPPLRERPEDIAPLAQRFAERAAREETRDFIAFSSAAIRRMTSAPWPGNVRQLENAVRRAVVLSNTGLIGPSEFEPGAGAPVISEPQAGRDGFFTEDGHIRTLADIETAAMEAAMARYGGSISEAARRLDVGRSTLYRRLKGAAAA